MVASWFTVVHYLLLFIPVLNVSVDLYAAKADNDKLSCEVVLR